MYSLRYIVPIRIIYYKITYIIASSNLNLFSVLQHWWVIHLKSISKIILYSYWHLTLLKYFLNDFLPPFMIKLLPSIHWSNCFSPRFKHTYIYIYVYIILIYYYYGFKMTFVFCFSKLNEIWFSYYLIIGFRLEGQMLFTVLVYKSECIGILDTHAIHRGGIFLN